MTNQPGKPHVADRGEQISLKRAGECLLYALAALIGCVALVLVWAGPQGHHYAPLTAAAAIVVVVALAGGLLWATEVRRRRRAADSAAIN